MLVNQGQYCPLVTASQVWAVVFIATKWLLLVSGAGGVAGGGGRMLLNIPTHGPTSPPGHRFLQPNVYTAEAERRSALFPS